MIMVASSIHPSIHRPIDWLIDWSIHPFTHSFIHSFSLPFSQLFSRSFINLFIHPSILSSIHVVIHPSIHPLRLHPEVNASCTAAIVVYCELATCCPYYGNSAWNSGRSPSHPEPRRIKHLCIKIKLYF